MAKGKNGKVALIAVCNKLLKQGIAFDKSAIPNRPDFATISACKPWLLTQFMLNISAFLIFVIVKAKPYAGKKSPVVYINP